MARPFGLFPRSGAGPMSLATLRHIAIAGAGALLLSVQTASSFGPTEVYRATEAIDYVLGSTRAIGYFQTVAGHCQLPHDRRGDRSGPGSAGVGIATAFRHAARASGGGGQRRGRGDVAHL